MSIKFEQGQVYHTVKTLGVIAKEDGRLQISQRLGKDGIADIEPTEKLTFAGRDGGKLWFLREDGSRVCGHRSHFDPEDAYNSAESLSSTETMVRARAKVSKAEAEVERAAAKLAQMMKEAGEEIPALADESSTSDSYVAPSADARAEAAALFASNNS